MKRKRDSGTKREETLTKCQTRLSDISSKLTSLGLILSGDETSSDYDPKLDGLGLILKDISNQVLDVIEQIDPTNLK